MRWCHLWRVSNGVIVKVFDGSATERAIRRSDWLRVSADWAY